MEREINALRTILTSSKPSADGANGALYGRIVPYNVPDGRPGELNGKKYTDTVYEPGSFSGWIDAYGTSRTRFLFDHGDADMPLSRGHESGVNALPIGVVRQFGDEADGLYFDADFASSALAQNVRELADMGGLTDISFASAPVVQRVEADGFRHVYESQLWDVSVVVWGQFLEGSPILEVYRKETEAMEVRKRQRLDTLAREFRDMSPSTIGSCAEACVYDAVTDMITNLRTMGVIDSAQMVALANSATAIMSSVGSALGELADVEAPYWVVRGYYSHDDGPKPNPGPETPIADPAPARVADPEPDADEAAAVELRMNSRIAQANALLES